MTRPESRHPSSAAGPRRSHAPAPRILLIEDNADLAAGIDFNLKLEGYEVRIADHGAAALEIARDWSPALVLLDLMLPDMDGYQILQQLRAGGNTVPVIILTARAEEADKVRGFRLDADQYVTKPFGILELLERIAALLRRRARDAETPERESIEFGNIRINLNARTVSRRGEPCALTPKAYELLLALVRRDGAVATRAELLREVWGYGGFVMSRTVDTHVAELRRKIDDDAANPKHIITVWKAGYRLVK